MSQRGNGRRIYALADCTAERTSRGWYFGRTSRFGDAHAMKGPYSSERSVVLMIARELIKKNSQARFPTPAPRMTGSLFLLERHAPKRRATSFPRLGRRCLAKSMWAKIRSTAFCRREDCKMRNRAVAAGAGLLGAECLMQERLEEVVGLAKGFDVDGAKFYLLSHDRSEMGL